MLPAVNNCGSVSETLISSCKETDIISNKNEDTDARITLKEGVDFVEDTGANLVLVNSNTNNTETIDNYQEDNKNKKSLSLRFYDLLDRSKNLLTRATTKKSDAPLLLNVPKILEKNNCNEEKSTEREKWSRKTEFLLAIIGFSVDLGNVWRCKLNV